MEKSQKGIALTLVSAVFNASTYLVTALALTMITAETMLVYWFLWGMITFSAYFALRGRASRLFQLIRDRRIALLGLVNTVSALLWTYGIFFGGPALTAFVFRFEAVFTVIIGVMLLRERLSRSDILGVLLAVSGAFVMAYEATEVILFSIFIVMLAALFSSISVALAKVYVKNTDSLSLAAGRSLYILMGSLALGLMLNRIGPPPGYALFLTFLGGFLGAFLGFFIFYKSLSYYQLSKAIAVRSIEPFFAVILALAILLAAPSPTEIIGGSIIVAGVVILSLKPNYLNQRRII